MTKEQTADFQSRRKWLHPAQIPLVPFPQITMIWRLWQLYLNYTHTVSLLCWWLRLKEVGTFSVPPLMGGSWIEQRTKRCRLVTNKQQVDSSVESAECCTHFWTWKVRLPVAAQPHAEHHFTGKHFCVLWFLTGSGLTAEAARQLRSPRKSRTSSIWAWSTKFCAVGCSGQEPMFTIPWVGMAGFKSLCTCWQWPSTFACFQSSSQVN